MTCELQLLDVQGFDEGKESDVKRAKPEPGPDNARADQQHSAPVGDP